MDAGAPERTRALVREQGERAFRFAYRLTGDVEQARDLVSEAFARVLSRWGQYDAGRSLEGWFFAILRHLLLDAAKRFEKRALVSLDAPLDAWGDNASSLAERLQAPEEGLLERLEREESAERVRGALDRLPWEYRSALVLCDMEGMRYGEISRLLGCPVGTVRSRLHRARSAMRMLLAAELEPGTAPPPALTGKER